MICFSSLVILFFTKYRKNLSGGIQAPYYGLLIKKHPLGYFKNQSVADIFTIGCDFALLKIRISLHTSCQFYKMLTEFLFLTRLSNPKKEIFISHITFWII